MTQYDAGASHGAELPPTLPDGAPTGEEADRIRAEIAATRADLAETVDALAHKVDVKAQAGERVDATKERLADAAARAKAATPPPVRRTLDQVGDRAAPYRRQLTIGAVALVVIALVGRRTRRNRG